MKKNYFKGYAYLFSLLVTAIAMEIRIVNSERYMYQEKNEAESETDADTKSAHCENGAPDQNFPDCCFNGGFGKFCCTNGANNWHCCINGANVRECLVITTN